MKTLSLIAFASFSAVHAQQVTSARLEPPKPASRAATPATFDRSGLYCSDALSEALLLPRDMPCWADLRSEDRQRLSESFGEATPALSMERSHAASMTAAFLFGNALIPGRNPAAYGGVLAGSAAVRRRAWQFAIEDAASGAALRTDGAVSPSGLNRLAARFRADLTPRLRVQLRTTNSYGEDAYRIFAPLDDHRSGLTSVPAVETAAYGLRNGRVLDLEDDAQLRYLSSRKTSVSASISNSLLRYQEPHTSVQVLRGKADVLHSVTSNVSLGMFASASAQTSDQAVPRLHACSLAGGGLAMAVRSSRVALEVRAGAAHGTTGCGQTVVPLGSLDFSAKLAPSSAFFVALSRDASRGVLPSAPLMSSASLGFRENFARRAGLEVMAGGLLGKSQLTSRNSTDLFADAEIHYPLGKYLMQQTSVRRFQQSASDRATGIPAGRTVLTFTLWLVRPGRGQSESQ